MKVSVIIPAAGCGRRMGDVKKPYLDLAGKPILAHTLMVFQQCSLVSRIVVVVAVGDEADCVRDIIIPYEIDKADQVVAGGETRQESVFSGLQELSSDTDMVMVHDCVRPFVTEDMIERVLEAASNCGAATVAVPVKDTIKEADDESFVINTLDRQRLWSIQTPQAFKYDLLLQAHLYARENNIQVTDDASLIDELDGHRVKLVMGTSENIKITTPGDLTIAEAILGSKKTV
ncbi:2-C-methyl-D-erythritol 4-phosphate cytidylyltransferase [Candidatus Poribacteria bacterium]